MNGYYCEDCYQKAIRKGCGVLPCGRHVKPFVPSKNGVLKAIETWRLTIPIHDNDGNRYPELLIEMIRNHVLSVFGGETGVNTTGRWKQDQRIWKDENIRVEIDVYVEHHDIAEAFMVAAKRDLIPILKQERIYVTLSQGRFELLLADEFRGDLGLNIEPPKTLDQAAIDLCLTLAAAERSTRDTTEGGIDEHTLQV